MIEVEDIPVDKTVVSLHLDDEAGVMLVNFNGGEIQLLNLEDRSFLQVLRGQRQSWFVLRPTLGGKNGSLTISGSEDSRVRSFCSLHSANNFRGFTNTSVNHERRSTSGTRTAAAC